jgi:hypothetical protein
MLWKAALLITEHREVSVKVTLSDTKVKSLMI